MKITPGVIMVAVLASSLVGALVFSCHMPATWENNPRPIQSGVQPADPPLQSGRSDQGSAAILDGIAGCFVVGQPLAVECLEGAPRCPHEDGDPSGWPCLWMDPDTGQPWYVDSREYW